MSTLAQEIMHEISQGDRLTLAAVEKAIEKFSAVENAEFGVMPTSEMKDAYERFIVKFNGNNVNARDVFYHGFLAGVNHGL